MFIISKWIERRRIKTMVRSLIESIKGYIEGTGNHVWTSSQRTTYSSSYWLYMNEFRCEGLGITFFFDSDYDLVINTPVRTRIERKRARPLLKYLINIMQDDVGCFDDNAPMPPNFALSENDINNRKLIAYHRILSGYYQAKTDFQYPTDLLSFRASLSKVEGETLIIASEERKPTRLIIYFTNDKAGAKFKLES